MKREENQRFIETADKAIKEMKENKLLLLKRGDLFGEKKQLYREMMEEIKETKNYLENGGEFNQAYRHLQMNVFMKHESFFMDLFETCSYPKLFELFELE